jgi:uncharacterized protein with von Willebrand factor type A (vWA) domain
VEHITISVIEAYTAIKIGSTTVEDTRTAMGTTVVEMDIVVDIETETITTEEATIIEEMDSTVEATITIVVISISAIIAHRYLPTTRIITITTTTRI